MEYTQKGRDCLVFKFPSLISFKIFSVTDKLYKQKQKDEVNILYI